MLGIISHDPANPICPICRVRPMWLTLGRCLECHLVGGHPARCTCPLCLPLWQQGASGADHDHLCSSCGLSPHIEAGGTCAECREPVAS